MAKKKNPNIIDYDLSIDVLAAYGIRVEIMNYYQFRLFPDGQLTVALPEPL